ncbi:MAG: phosphoglycolate phosphatase [Pseudomonadales bacterium]
MSWHRPYRGYLFDLDGTLIDTAPDLCRAQNAALAQHGFEPASEADTRHWVGHGARVLLQKAIAAQRDIPVPETQLDAMHAEFLTYYQDNIAVASQVYPEVISTLNTLAERGAQLAVVTNKLEGLSRVLLDAIQMSGHFDLLIGGDTAGVAKPAADPAQLACKTLGLEADEVLFVGDSTTDVGCARAFGCPVVCVSYGYSQGVPANELGADGVIDSFAALL